MNQQIVIPNTPDSIIKELAASMPLTIGDITAVPKKICPALSKMLEILSICLAVNIGLTFLSKFSIYDNLEFIGESTRY